MDTEILKLAYADWKKSLSAYKTKYNYYKGKTYAIDRIKAIDAELKKESNIINLNLIRKFIKEEIAYSLGNAITFQNINTDNEDVVSDINYYTAHWSKKHNREVLKNALIFNEAYELYYIDKDASLSSVILNPLNCYIYEDDYGNTEFAMHIFGKKFQKGVFIDVYAPEGVYHYEGEDFIEKGFQEYYFGQVPISVCRINIPEDDDTIFDDIHKIQDAYSINVSNISSEITEYRLSYLKIKKGKINEEDIPALKKLGVLQGDFEDIDWLIKNINDVFVQNTLDRLKEDMYEITGHLNTNEKLASNVSGVTLRSRLISLENRCKLNQQSMHDCINNRLKILFVYLYQSHKKEYNWRQVDCKFTLSIPHDDYLTAQIINLLGDKISSETSLEQLSFIVNGKLEKMKVDKENEQMINLDNIIDDGDDE